MKVSVRLKSDEYRENISVPSETEIMENGFQHLV